MAERQDDPGLPIKFGPCSNGEYVPAPLTAVGREAIPRAHAAYEADARRLMPESGDNPPQGIRAT